ncbi:hypothetical protein CHARACLAT_005583 [Characodon lateralis]|uniref:Uncharacterized protein n=1 Tax=Characodon lateralis TaxID=208331 RepID=A0ABU7ERG0_9TELE|nr:hypothetical protein [Characodon lateralis]
MMKGVCVAWSVLCFSFQRYGEHSTPFCVSALDNRRDGEFSRRIHDAVERASLDIQSGSSSDEEDEVMDKSMSSNSSLRSLSGPCPTTSFEAKTIPTVSNPNSVYRFSEFSPGAPQTWVREKKKGFPGDSFSSSTGCPPSQFSNQKGFKAYRAAFTFTGPRVDKYHWRRIWSVHFERRTATPSLFSQIS